jgi:hypothetical protein
MKGISVGVTSVPRAAGPDRVRRSGGDR